MPGVHSVHRLPGAVAVVANSWWRARMAVEALQVTWTEPAPDVSRAMPADFSTEAHLAALKAAPGDGIAFEEEGDVSAALAGAAKVVEASYDAPYLAHGQLEPPSALVRWNEDGTLELWAPNQAPEMFQAHAAKVADIEPGQVIVHSPLLGGFFGRHFLYETANPFPQAILLSKAVGRPIKLIWSREEEFLRDALRPMSAVRFRAGLDADGLPVALHAVSAGEGPAGRWFGRDPDKVDSTAVEGIAGKVYAIKNRRVGHIHVDDPAIIGFWRSVGHSMNDFFMKPSSTKWPMSGGMIPMSCATVCWPTVRVTETCLKRLPNWQAAGSADPLRPRMAAAAPGVSPWPRLSAVRWRLSPKCRSSRARSLCMTSGWPLIRAASSTRQSSKLR
ncbi:xanthine dehydrogenase family protein molybdopterin-binding subunit [Paracoccus kondratievae]